MSLPASGMQELSFKMLPVPALGLDVGRRAGGRNHHHCNNSTMLEFWLQNVTAVMDLASPHPGS